MYIKQRDEFSCGPVAIINALKWAGHDYTYQALPTIRRLCRCKDEGTHSENLTRGLEKLKKRNKLKFKYNDLEYPTLLKIDKHLKKGSLIFLYRENNQDIGHYIFINSKKENWYSVVNYSKKTKGKMHRKTLMRLVKNRFFDMPSVWYIK